MPDHQEPIKHKVSVPNLNENVIVLMVDHMGDDGPYKNPTKHVEFLGTVQLEWGTRMACDENSAFCLHLALSIIYALKLRK